MSDMIRDLSDQEYADKAIRKIEQKHHHGCVMWGWRRVRERWRLFRRWWRLWYQRRTRGWDDSETWNLDHSIAVLLLPRLIRFKELNNGHPGQFSSMEEWNAVLDDVIYCFEFYAGGGPYDLNGEEGWDKERAAKGLKAFVEFYNDLWW